MPGDFEAINANLVAMDWNFILSGHDEFNSLWTAFKTVSHNLISNHVPEVKSSVTYRSRSTNPQIKQAMKLKLDAHRALSLNRNEENKEIFDNAVLNLKLVINGETKRFEQSLLSNPDIGKFYSYVNKRLHSSYSHHAILKNGRQVDDKEKAKMFNDYFASFFINDDGIRIAMKHRPSTIRAHIDFTPYSI